MLKEEKNGKLIQPQANLGIIPRSLRIELEPVQVTTSVVEIELEECNKYGHSEQESLAVSLKDAEGLHGTWLGALQQRGSSSWFGSWAQHPVNGSISLLLCAQALLNFVL